MQLLCKLRKVIFSGGNFTKILHQSGKFTSPNQAALGVWVYFNPICQSALGAACLWWCSQPQAPSNFMCILPRVFTHWGAHHLPVNSLLLPRTPKLLHIASVRLELHMKMSHTTFAFQFRALQSTHSIEGVPGLKFGTSCPRSLNLGQSLGSWTSCATWKKMRGLDWLLFDDEVVEGSGLFGAEDLDKPQFEWERAKGSRRSKVNLLPLAAHPLPQFPGIWGHSNNFRAHISLHKAITSQEFHPEFQWLKVINTLSHKLSYRFPEGGANQLSL